MNGQDQDGGLIIDFDNTMLVDGRFYKQVYAKAIEDAIVEARGEWGRKMLHWHRESTGHMGILALPFFGVSFTRFAEILAECSFDDLQFQPHLAETLRRLRYPIVIFSGSPRAFIQRVLHQWGIEVSLFCEIVAWNPGEEIPIKHSWSPMTFQAIADRHGWMPSKTWSLGDSWHSDLGPARQSGMRVIGIGQRHGPVDAWFDDLTSALEYLLERDEEDRG